MDQLDRWTRRDSRVLVDTNASDNQTKPSVTIASSGLAVVSGRCDFASVGARNPDPVEFNKVFGRRPEAIGVPEKKNEATEFFNQWIAKSVSRTSEANSIIAKTRDEIPRCFEKAIPRGDIERPSPKSI